MKVSRYLTHIKRLRDTAVYLERFLERIEPLADAGKLGPLLWQLPPTFQRDDERLAAALSDLPPGLRHAIEFRHESWFTDRVWELLREHNVALVIADGPDVRSFQTRELTADFVYVRFHQGTRGRRGNYSRRASFANGSGRSASGPPIETCTPTSTTTGRRSRRPTRAR